MKTKLVNGKLSVVDETGGIYEVIVKDVDVDMFLNIELLPIINPRANRFEGEYVSVDLLNETIVEALKEYGYTVI